MVALERLKLERTDVDVALEHGDVGRGMVALERLKHAASGTGGSSARGRKRNGRA